MEPCATYAREDWVEPSSRNTEWMKQNTGEDSAHTFVYFPKTKVSGASCLLVPIGAQFYKGIEGTPCNNVDDPSDSTCLSCTQPAWYSDYKTAMIYSALPTRIYAFETLKELTLVNLLDIQNVKIIIEKLIEKIEEIPLKDYTPPDWITSPSIKPPSTMTEQDIEDKRKIHKLQLYVDFICYATNYVLPTNILEKYFPKSHFGQLYTPRKVSTNPPDPNPDDLAKVSTEFGDQTALFRNSTRHVDMAIPFILKIVFGDSIHGYYAPRYQSLHHREGCSGTPLQLFAREICLLSSKDLVKHNKTNSLDGCNIKTELPKTYVAPTAPAPSLSPPAGQSPPQQQFNFPSLSGLLGLPKPPVPPPKAGDRRRTYRKKSKTSSRKTVSKTYRNEHTDTSK